MPSERYAAVAIEVTNRLATLGQAEFHATEVVNPKTTSPWRQVPLPERLEAFCSLGELLAAPPTKLYYAFVSKGQYEQLRTEAEEVGAVSVAHKMGLKRVFLRCLFERLGSTAAETIVVLDQDKPLAAPEVENWAEGALLCGGGPIVAASASVAGLQLADLAVFSIGRYARKRQDIAAGNGNAFDEIVLKTIAALEGRCEHLLNSAPAEPV
jgi:hypothetical protein